MRNRFGRPSMAGLLQNAAIRRGLIFGFILLIGLILFEISNFFSTFLGLKDILGDASLFGLRWSLILGFAFCAVDLAGLGRLFTPEQGRDEPAEVWYLFAAWFLAAGFDAFLTWLAVRVAIATNMVPSTVMAVFPNMVTVFPFVVAAFELLIRVALISTFSTMGERLFTQLGAYGSRNTASQSNSPTPRTPSSQVLGAPRPVSQNATYRPTYGAPGNVPTYHPVGETPKRER